MLKPLFTALTVSLAIPPLAGAAGLRIGFMDTFATGRGNAFAATADSPAAIFYNPAGITQGDGSEVQAGAYVIQFSSRHIAPDGTVTDMEDRFKPVPHLYFVHNDPDTAWAFGVGAYLPFGLITDWPREATFSMMATKSELTYLRVTPVVAYQVNPQLSFSAGPSFNYSELKLRRTLGFAPGDEFIVDLDDTAAGYILGVLWHPAPRHSVGVSYHSKTDMRYTGSAEARPFAPAEEARLSMPFPDIVIAGYSFRPTPDWNFEFNVDWTRWGRLNVLRLERTTGTDDLPFHWRDTFFYGFGATRYLPDGHYLSLGYLYTGNAVPNETFTPAVPDSRLHFYSLGFGRHTGRLSWDAAYHYAYGPTREVTGPTPAAGHYENHIHGLALSVAVNF